ncbi:MAG TPA: hypothetical protein VJT09_17025 [Pyrinomonadaceae bacterium]|nr:hypothetical protein [Pyrinomonadaceae bacterium]
MFSKLIGLAFLIAAFPWQAPAQERSVEYGQATELRGVSRIFVDTGADTQQRNLIVREIQKRLPELEVVSRPEESDIHVRFFLTGSAPGKTDWLGTVVKIVGSNRVRVLFSYKDNTPPLFDDATFLSSAMELAKPHIFVSQFVRAYKKANGADRI